jgi:hypothetical protein
MKYDTLEYQGLLALLALLLLALLLMALLLLSMLLCIHGASYLCQLVRQLY